MKSYQVRVYSFPIPEFEKFALLILLLVASVVYKLGYPSLVKFVNIILPLMLATIMGFAVYATTKSNTAMIWSPLNWFRVSSGVYFGIGSSLIYVMNDVTHEHIWYGLRYSEDLNAKFNVIVTLSVLIVITTSEFIIKILNYRITLIKKPQYSSKNIILFGVVFLIVGAYVKYIIVLPYWIVDGNIVPGIVFKLSGFIYAGMYLLMLHSLNKGIITKLLVIQIIIIDLVISTVMFSKSQLLLSIIFPLLAYTAHKFTIGRVAFGVGLALTAFIVAQPMVDYGRMKTIERYGGLRGGGVIERFGIISEYIDYRRSAVGRSEIQRSLARFSFVNIGTMVVDRYDNGFPGNTLRHVFAVFVPRVVWADKPIITEIGSETYYLATGNRGSSYSEGIFAEGYWNFGWVGIPTLMIPIAFMLVVFSIVSFRIMVSGDWYYMPIVFFGANLGMKVDGHFVSDFVGASWISFWAYLFLILIRHIIFTISRESPKKMHVRENV